MLTCTSAKRTCYALGFLTSWLAQAGCVHNAEHPGMINIELPLQQGHNHKSSDDLNTSTAIAIASIVQVTVCIHFRVAQVL